MKVKSFKIYPSRASKWYYTVHIFAQKRTMYRYRKLLQTEDNANPIKSFKFLALVSAFNSNHKEYQYGEILFTKNSGSRSGIVSHELCHALTYWWKHMESYKWKEITNNGRADERHALLLGKMVQQYWYNWWKK